MNRSLTILVPKGIEHRAIRRALQKTAASSDGVAIPMGASAGAYVEAWLRDRPAPPCAVILMGLCGGLAPQLAPGSTVIYQRCIYPASGASLDCDRPLIDWLCDRLPHALPVTGLTSDRVIAAAAEKQHLHHITHADVVDMEGYFVLKALKSAGLPAAMVRVVSDGSSHSLPDLTGAIAADGSLQGGKMAIAFLKQPIAAWHLIRGALRGVKQLERVGGSMVEGEGGRVEGG